MSRRHNAGKKETTPLDAIPLDSEEQDKIIFEMKEANERSDVFWRKVFGSLSIVFAVACLGIAMSHCISPYRYQHQVLVEEIMPWSVMLTSYAFMTFSYACCWYICIPHKGGSTTNARTAALLTAIVPLLIWGNGLIASGAVKLLWVWLPLGPLGWLGVCSFVIANMEGIRVEIDNLEALKYPCKTA